jgi:hypothetical protein
MIITIKGATYTYNIGALDSWFISRSIGSGATYDGVTSVKKGESFSATVTIKEGYEIGSAGITVTMGGEDITDRAVLTSDEVIVISIAPVEGNVVISVPTKNIATGEEEGGGEVVDPETPDNPDTEMGLTYKLNRNIDTAGTISIYNGRIAIPEFFETNGAAVTVSHSGGLEVLLRYYTKDKVFQSTADGSTYCRLVLRTDNEGSSDVGGTPLTNDTVNNTTLTINGTVYTLTNKIEENEIMYWINTNLNNKSPFLQVWNDRLTIDDSFATNGTEATVVYNGSNYTVSSIASRYFKTYTYVTDKTTSSNVRFVFVGSTGSTNATAGTAMTNSNILDGETLTVNGTVYTFI